MDKKIVVFTKHNLIPNYQINDWPDTFLDMRISVPKSKCCTESIAVLKNNDLS